MGGGGGAIPYFQRYANAKELKGKEKQAMGMLHTCCLMAGPEPTKTEQVGGVDLLMSPPVSK